MLIIDDKSITKLTNKPDNYLLCLRGTRHQTLSAERKGFGAWLRSRIFDRESYKLSHIIFNLRKTKQLSFGLIKTCDRVVEIHNSEPGNEKCLTLSEQMELYNQWQKVVIKFLIEKLKRGAVLELVFKDGGKKHVEFSHFYEYDYLYCYHIENPSQLIRYSEQDLRSIKIVAFAMSQWKLISRKMLPGVDIRAREYLRARGVQFRDSSNVVLPADWKQVAREHPLWIDLYDDLGNKVGELFHRSDDYEEVSKFTLKAAI